MFHPDTTTHDADAGDFATSQDPALLKLLKQLRDAKGRNNPVTAETR
jgi:hypothetical protein